MIRPDEAMGRLYPGLPPAGPPPPAPGAELDVMARLALCVDAMGAAAQRFAEAQHRARLSWNQCHPIDIPPEQSAAAGVLDPTDIWGPRQGYAWHVMLIPAELGPAGTLMSLYRDAPVQTNLLFQSTVSGLFEPRRLILLPGRRLVWSSAGDALTVGNGIAIEVDIDILPVYLMGCS